MWLYKYAEVNSIDDLPDGVVGFVYKITSPSGKIYIGKKQLKNTQRRKISKKLLKSIEGRGKRPSKITVVTESNWLDYWGSCKPLLEEIERNGNKDWNREIIELCYSKKQLSYYEVCYQIRYDVLKTNSYNETILGKFFRKDLIHD